MPPSDGNPQGNGAAKGWCAMNGREAERGSVLLMRLKVVLLTAALCGSTQVLAAKSANKPGASKESVKRTTVDENEDAPPTGVDRTAVNPAARHERRLLLRPNDKKAHLNAARSYLALAQGADSHLSDAARHVEAVLKDQPRDFEALMLAGEVANRKGQYAEAAMHYQNAAQVNSTSAEAQLALGGVLDRIGDTGGSDAAYRRFRALSGLPPLPTSIEKTR
jgi:Flp pilus assembly protein TadD